MFSRLVVQTAAGINRRFPRAVLQARFFTQQHQKQARSRLLSPFFISTTSAIVATGLTFAVMSTQHHDDLLEQKIALNGTADHEVEEATKYLNNMTIVKEARSNKNMFEIEAYSHLNGSAKLHSLTASTLRGKGKVIVAPVIFYNKSMTEVTIVCHLGTELCGHDGIIHGGMLATLLDEVLACVAFPALPNNIGFTANLNIDYRKPVKSDQWVVMRGQLDRLEGRKAYVEAWIEDLEGTKMTEAKSLYVAPKSIIPKIGS
ncbi:hypothetical protein PHYBLDRAFT_171869 [Phycomyces blakesleeanus NRRL 1555(-)]|uniref:Thioesterase domain-containing protein n=2 Tax=Phycomyces blakesleeanus TaxID=4837 RepID=A0A167L8S9_PHYB8|nr:hypothetical protein PHYBLDRAFT_171869 [Phycomyces blakesleeanus NRRL 1555(-)]OAD69848.1 hypothetical protein PHYBLDRAFT_171869 [Phycomyces blakesleeanus NRRL 1555(-)]|eukprot:XP_018287888.1 hypothetical protein PHYBLDRAFT_171869 [Phycomyces blakesleeanus NRRL 1555(-)]